MSAILQQRRVSVRPFSRGLDNLTVFPRMGRKQSTPGVRKLVTRRYSYLVYYKVDMAAREVVVLNIKHPARKRKYKNA